MHKAVIRSLTQVCINKQNEFDRIYDVVLQSALVERNHLFGQYMSDWLVDRFFTETVGISFEKVKQSFGKIQDDFGHPSLRESQRIVVQVSLILDHILSSSI